MCAGRQVDIDDVYESVGSVASGTMTVEDLREMTETAIQAPGVCAALGTAKTMHVLAEVLGMALPGRSPPPGEKMFRFAQAAGGRIVEMVREDLRPRNVLTPAALADAVEIALVALQRLLEFRLSRRKRTPRPRQGSRRTRGRPPQTDGRHARLVARLHVRGRRSARPDLPAYWPVPLALFLLVQPLRYWAIFSLGESWNTSILVVPGAKPVRRGPYRYLKHPNYAVVVVEVLTFPLVFAAWVTALVFTALNAAFLYMRVREEERALKEFAES